MSEAGRQRTSNQTEQNDVINDTISRCTITEMTDYEQRIVWNGTTATLP